MQITSSSESLHQVRGDWLIHGVWEDEPLGGSLDGLDGRLEGMLARLKGRGDLAGGLKSLTPLWDIRGLGVERLLLIGLGPRGKATRETLAMAGGAAARSLTGRP